MSVGDYLQEVGGEEWEVDKLPRVGETESTNAAQKLIEFAGRMCYRSWKPGLNPNVKKIRRDAGQYLDNI